MLSPDDMLRASFAEDGPAFWTPDGCELKPFQRGGVAYALEALAQRHACVIGDDMGLGKTIQALTVANAMAHEHVTVVCPASLRVNWAREAAKWCPMAKLTIIGYDELVRLEKKFESPKPTGLLICDEAHYLKNPEAKRTICALAIEAMYRLFLTGTPIVNRPIELWPILNVIGIVGSRHEYALKFCDAKQMFKHIKIRGQHRSVLEWDYSGASNLKELQHLLRSTVMVRRLKRDVLKDLPPKTRQLIEIPWQHNAEDKKLLAACQRLWKTGPARSYTDETIAGLSVKEITDQISKVRHEQALKKVPAVVSHILDALQSVQKIIVFAYHRDVMMALLEELRKEGVVHVWGGMADEWKQSSVDAFQNEAKTRIFIGQMDVCGEGLNLTAADLVIFAELGWVPGKIQQCEDRAHRIGQTKNVLIQHLVAEGSIDALMTKVLLRKQKVLDATLDSTTHQISFDWLEELATVESGDTV